MAKPPPPADIRFVVEPGDVPAAKVARRLHLSPSAFEACKVKLFLRGFPRPDPDTGMYDLEAVDRWRHRRHPGLFPELTGGPDSSTPDAPAKSMGAIAREAQERRRNG